MRWQAETRKERRARKKSDNIKKFASWHKCFAWLPVRLTNNKNEVRWLEFVYRKGEFIDSDSGLFGTSNYYKWQYADSIFGILKASE